MIALLAPVLAVLAVTWLGLLVAAPHLPLSAAGPLYLFGSFICHQIAERSFHIDGAQLPVCARCVGIYAGAAAGAVAATVGRPRRFRNAALVVALAAVPTVLTLVVEWAGVWVPSNVARALAGAIFGIILAVVIMDATRSAMPGVAAPTLD